MIIIFSLQILEKMSYGLSNISFEKPFFVTKMTFWGQKMRNIIFFISFNNEWFCLKHKCFWFSAFEILFWSQKKWTSQSDVWKSIGPFLKILEPKNDYSCWKELEIVNFWQKWLFIGKNDGKFDTKSYLKTLIYW